MNPFFRKRNTGLVDQQIKKAYLAGAQVSNSVAPGQAGETAFTKFNRGKCTVPDTNISWRPTSWKAAFPKRLGVLVDNQLTMMQYCGLAARRPTPSRATWASVARKSKSTILPFFLAPVRSHLGTVPSLGFLEQERHRHTGASPGRGTRVVEGL